MMDDPTSCSTLTWPGIIAEHANNTVIVIARPNGKIFSIVTLKMLLPLAFTPAHLKK